MSEFALRCDRCHHCLDHATAPMQLIYLFHASSPARIPQIHPEEARHRCRSCGYVNVFQPVRESSRVVDIPPPHFPIDV